MASAERNDALERAELHRVGGDDEHVAEGEADNDGLEVDGTKVV